jgi:hypothetical protein
MKNLLLATARVTVIIVPVAFGVATALLSAQNPGNPAGSARIVSICKGRRELMHARFPWSN